MSHDGETRLRSRSRRRLWLFGAIFLAGLLPGIYVGYTRADGLFDPTQSWPPALSIGLAAIFLIAVLTGAVMLQRQMDELERQNNLKATGFAASLFVIVYPVWFLLWMGDLVPEPSHAALFLTFYAGFLGAAIYYRLR